MPLSSPFAGSQRRPPVKMTEDQELEIVFEPQCHPYRPGDSVSGSVHVKLEKDSSLGTICVRLFGRTKSRIEVSNGQYQSAYRATMDLFSLESIPHSDKFTHKAGDYVFPFDFKLPEHDVLMETTPKWKAIRGFQSNAGAETAKSLPPSMAFKGYERGRASYASISYGVEAEVFQPVFSSPWRSRKWTKRLITVLPHPPPMTLDPFDVVEHHGSIERVVVQTFRLLPQNAHHLSLKQRALSVIGSSQVPKYSFDFDVSYHSVLQANNDKPLTFIVAAIPITDSGSTTIHPSMLTFYRYPNITIKSFRLMIKGYTNCRCPGAISEEYAGEVQNIELMFQQFSDLKLGARSIALDQKDGREDSSPTYIDLGRKCNVSVGNRIPSFTSYHVLRYYHLAWHIEMECAGEKIDVKGESPQEIKILSPSVLATDNNEVTWYSGDPDLDDSDEEEAPTWSADEEILPAYSTIPNGEVSTTLLRDPNGSESKTN